MKFMDLITVDRIVPDLESTSKEEAIKEVMSGFKFSKKEFETNLELVMERESRGTTGMGEGIAIPHTNQSKVKDIIGVLGVSQKGVDFASLDGEPVHLIFMVLSSDSHKELHIEGLKYISKKMRNSIYKRFILEAKGKRGVLRILKEIDQKED